jgi:membrane-associated phospholipid phosphatase
MSRRTVGPGPRRHRTTAVLTVSASIVLCGAAVLTGRLLFTVPFGAELRFLDWLGPHRTAALTTIEQGLTFLGSPFWLVCVGLVAVAWLLARRRPGDALFIAVAGLGSSAITNLVKVIVDKPRPGVLPHLVTTSTLSFPSGHACSAAAVYTALGMVLTRARPRLRRVAVVVAGLLAMAIAFSRVYLGVHYPTDVVAGLVLGWLWVSAAWLAGRGPAGGDRGDRGSSAGSRQPASDRQLPVGG